MQLIFPSNIYIISAHFTTLEFQHNNYKANAKVCGAINWAKVYARSSCWKTIPFINPSTASWCRYAQHTYHTAFNLVLLHFRKKETVDIPIRKRLLLVKAQLVGPQMSVHPSPGKKQDEKSFDFRDNCISNLNRGRNAECCIYSKKADTGKQATMSG